MNPSPYFFTLQHWDNKEPTCVWCLTLQGTHGLKCVDADEYKTPEQLGRLNRGSTGEPYDSVAIAELFAVRELAKMRQQYDRLAEIKERWAHIGMRNKISPALSDVDWLITEVERLQARATGSEKTVE